MNIDIIRQQLDALYADNKLAEGYQFLLTKLQEAMTNKEDAIVLGLLSEILGYLRVTGQFEEGNIIASKADFLVSSLGLEDTLIGATTYLNIATFYSIAKQVEKAAFFYQKVIPIYEKELPNNNEQLASLYNNLSIFYQQTKDFDMAYKYQQKAINIITTLPNCEIEIATSYTNLAEICYSLKQYCQGLKHVQKSISLFKKYNDRDPHYLAALATLANGYYHQKDFLEALATYDKALVAIAAIYGKTESYQIVKKNKEQVEQEYQLYLQKGLTIAKQYYEDIGKPILKEKFPTLFSRMAIGLVGMGSECFGYDDAISRDHDFGPGFCIWLTKKDYQECGKEVQSVYDSLPNTYKGYVRKETKHGANRVGIFSITEFYYQFIGPIPSTLLEWLTIPQNALATVTNGAIFHDPLQTFSTIRKQLLAYYPEDIRIKKIVAGIAKMAQAGQYNYARCMQRKEYVAASLAINAFVNATMAVLYLLNKQYMPFYKWAHHGLSKLAIGTTIQTDLTTLVSLPLQQDVWKKDAAYYQTHINEEDQKVMIIEKICQNIVKELQKQNLTSLDNSFLEDHTSHIINKIKDPTIRNRHIMEDY